MNRKLALLIGILAFFAAKTMAQDYKYGIYLGINGSNMSINSNLYYDDSEVFTKTIVDNTVTPLIRCVICLSTTLNWML